METAAGLYGTYPLVSVSSALREKRIERSDALLFPEIETGDKDRREGERERERERGSEFGE